MDNNAYIKKGIFSYNNINILIRKNFIQKFSLSQGKLNESTTLVKEFNMNIKQFHGNGKKLLQNE